MSLPWFRLYSEFAFDPIVQSLAFEDQRHFVVIMCLKCSGVIDREISKKNKEKIIFRSLGLDTVSAGEAKKRLQDVGLISDNWSPKSWNKRQFKSDNSSERVRKYRKTIENGNVSEPLSKRDSNAPEAEAYTEAYTYTDIKEKEEAPELNSIKRKSKSAPTKNKQTNEEWISDLSLNPAYAGIDMEKLNGKMIAWCELNRKQPTRRRFLNWLNREEAPMSDTRKKDRIDEINESLKNFL